MMAQPSPEEKPPNRMVTGGTVVYKDSGRSTPKLSLAFARKHLPLISFEYAEIYDPKRIPQRMQLGKPPTAYTMLLSGERGEIWLSGCRLGGGPEGYAAYTILYEISRGVVNVIPKLSTEFWKTPIPIPHTLAIVLRWNPNDGFTQY